jgi:hypothetical protein
MENVRSAGVLRSTGVTPLHHYYGPLRLPNEPADGYLFPPTVFRPPCQEVVTPGRVSQVPRGSFDARHPLSPRVAHPLHVLVASRMVSGFAASGRLTTTTGLTRPKRVHAFALRLTSSPSRAPTARLPASPPSWLHGERAIAMISTSQLTRSTRLSLTDQKETKATKSESRARNGDEKRQGMMRIVSTAAGGFCPRGRSVKTAQALPSARWGIVHAFSWQRSTKQPSSICKAYLCASP